MRGDERGARTLTIRRPADETRWRSRRPDRATNLHGFVTRPRPLLLGIDGARVWAEPGALPLATASVAAIDVAGVLEHVRDDAALYLELARVLRSGGELRALMPGAGRLAGIDALNLYAYASDLSRRGPRAPESEELKFRRHLALDELADALGRERFAIVAVRRRGLGVAEALRAATLVTTTIATDRADAYLRARPALDRLAALEMQVPVGGWWLEVVARRLPVTTD